MPATESVWRSLPLMHKVFAASALALFLATVAMFLGDYRDEWRKVQTVNQKLQTRQLEGDLSKLTTAEFEQKQSELKNSVEATDRLVAERKAKVEKVSAVVRKLDGEFQRDTQQVRFKRAERDVARANYDLAIRDSLDASTTLALKEKFNSAQALVDDLEFKLQQLTAKFDQAKAQRAELTRERDAAAADLKRHNFDLDRLETAKDKIAPTGLMAAKRMLMELPIVEGFNGPLKVNQIWLPNLTINYGGMTNVARFDRCTTCHVNIDRVNAGNVPAFPHDPKGITVDNAQEYLSGKKPMVHADGSPVGYAHPFSTHPQPELYLSSSSPHPLQKFGCTACHGGCGSGTSFQNASHSPDSPAQAAKWKEKYGYFYNHYWEYPMWPKRMMESACLQCHHDVVELGQNPTFGATAPKLYEGYELIREYGCFGCHEINGYNAGKAIGPDMRLEPQTPEEAERIAADPAARAGKLRKVGPGLRHFAMKTSRGWTEKWVANPKEFRPNTRMPLFFNLNNQKDVQGHNLQPVEIAGVVEYLFAKSEEVPLDKWADGYTPNAERGKQLFAERGCLSCHSHDEFPGIEQDMGPNLTNTHKKVSSAQWLYSWIREPSRHSARTKMPNLYLEPYTFKDEAIDPAADIAAWLLSKGSETWNETPLPVILGADFDRKFSAETARRLGLPQQRGVRVAAVLPHGPAARATGVSQFSNEIRSEGKSLVVDKPGLQLDDVILKWNGTEVNAPAEIDSRVAAAKPGEKVQLQIHRDGRQHEVEVTLDRAVTALARLNLLKVLPAETVEEVLKTNRYPQADAERLKAAPIKPDEIELAEGELNDSAWLRYLGRRTISRYGCYGCHEIPGFEKARPIGTALQDWGRKDPSKLALEHIEEFLHHHGEPEGSTLERVEKAYEDGLNNRFASADKADSELRAAYFVDQLQHHGRSGFLWQKLREPRSYDYKKTETKGYDERLKMPKFPFNEKQMEAITTFVLGLTAEPPAPEYVYRPEGPAKARIEGEKLIAAYNCAGCHHLEIPQVTFTGNTAELLLDLPEELRAKLQGGEGVKATEAERLAAYQKVLANEKIAIYARDAHSFSLASLDWAGVDALAKTIRVAAVDKPAHPVDAKALLTTVERLTKAAQGQSPEVAAKRLNGLLDTLSYFTAEAADHRRAMDALMALKPPVPGVVGSASNGTDSVIRFRGLVNAPADPEDDPADQEIGFNVWETLQLHGIVVPPSKPMTVKVSQLKSVVGRGGEFAEWLASHKVETDRVQRDVARAMAPPPLYKEGVKVQTPWLFSFLKNPHQIRYTPVLRMPQFTLSDEEAQTLANYFAAVDGATFPYQPIPQRDPGYLSELESAHKNYLDQGWQILTMPATANGKCIGCHSVGGQEFVAGDPTKVVRGPNLEGAVNRLQPDWTELWIFNPKWVTPYTAMPQNFPNGPSLYPQLFGGDGQQLSIGARDALMNYLRLLERSNRAQANAAPAAAAAPAAPPAEVKQ